jgi:hypothetical protein
MYHRYDSYSPYPYSQNRHWRGLETVELRLGVYYRISRRFFVDVAIDAPTGHSLLFIPSGTGVKPGTEFFQNTYGTFLPKVQLGISYQIK